MRYLLAFFLLLLSPLHGADLREYASFGYNQEKVTLNGYQFNSVSYNYNTAAVNFEDYDLGLEIDFNHYANFEIGFRSIPSQSLNFENNAPANVFVTFPFLDSATETQSINSQSMAYYLGYTIKPFGWFDLTARAGMMLTWGDDSTSINVPSLENVTEYNLYKFNTCNQFYELAIRRGFQYGNAELSLEAGYTFDSVGNFNYTLESSKQTKSYSAPVINPPYIPASSFDNSRYFVRVRLDWVSKI